MKKDYEFTLLRQARWCFNVFNFHPRRPDGRIFFQPQSDDVRRLFTIRLQFFLDVEPEPTDDQIISFMSDYYLENFFRAYNSIEYPLSEN